jgi:hypothetical protein
MFRWNISEYLNSRNGIPIWGLRNRILRNGIPNQKILFIVIGIDGIKIYVSLSSGEMNGMRLSIA